MWIYFNFLTYTVNHVRKYNDQTTQLAVEVKVDGSYDYRNLDYIVFIRLFYALVTEAEIIKMQKGLAQNLVQVHSVVEVKLLFTLKCKWIILRNCYSILGYS